MDGWGIIWLKVEKDPSRPLVREKVGDCSFPIGCGHYPWRMIWDKLQDWAHNQWEIEIEAGNFGKIVITAFMMIMVMMVIIMMMMKSLWKLWWWWSWWSWWKSQQNRKQGRCDLISDLCVLPLFRSFRLYEITFATRAGRGRCETFQNWPFPNFSLISQRQTQKK